MTALTAGTGTAGTGTAGAAFGARERLRAARRRARRRTEAVWTALAVVALALAGANVLLGSYTVTIPDFLRIVSGETIPGAAFVVMEIKLPRTAVAVLVGAAFGIGGTIFQTVLRNPLASPDVIGVTAGASASAVFGIAVVGASGLVLSAYAVGGALATLAGIVVLAQRSGVAGHRLVLVGIGMAAMLQAVTSYLLTRTDIYVASEALVWLNGSLNAASWPKAWILALTLLALLPLVVAAAARLPVLELGEEAAAGMGVHVGPSRRLLLLLGTALAAAATAAAGPVAFVAFLAGPISRRLTRGTSLVSAALVGACVVLAAEFISSNLIPGTALPVGVVTGALGGPFLIWLLVSANRVGRGG